MNNNNLSLGDGCPLTNQLLAKIRHRTNSDET